MASLSLPRVLQLKKNSLDAEREQFEKFQTLAIQKAINSVETPVKEKHVRSTIIGTFQEQSAVTYWMVALRLPLQDNRIVAWKFCHVTHKVLREGHPACLDDSQRHVPMIENLGKLWVHLREGYGRLVHLYCALLVCKLRFHARNPRFPGHMQLTGDELDNIAENDVNNYFQLCVELFDYMEDLLNLQAAVFESLGNARANSMTASGQCRLAALIPCAQDSSHIYDCNVRLLFRLHASLPPDTLAGHRERFRQQFKKLSQFYKHASSLQYYRNLLTLPVLPANPPNFLLQSDFGTYVTPVVSIPDPSPDELDAVGSLIDTSDTISQATTPEQFDFVETRATPSPQPDPVVERDRLIDHLQNELKRMRAEVSQLVQERSTMMSSMREHCTRLEKQLHEAKSELHEEKQKSELLVAQAPEIKQKLSETEEKAKVSDEKFQKLKGAYTQLREEHISLIRQKAEVDKMAASLRAAAAQHESAKQALQQQLNDRVKDVELLQQSASSSEEIEAYKSELSHLRSELEQSRLKELELETLKASMEALQIEHNTARTEQEEKITTITNELKEVTETLEALKLEKESKNSELSRVKEELVSVRENSDNEYKKAVEQRDEALRQVDELTQKFEHEKEAQISSLNALQDEVDSLKIKLVDTDKELANHKELKHKEETLDSHLHVKNNEIAEISDKLAALETELEEMKTNYENTLKEKEEEITKLQETINDFTHNNIKNSALAENLAKEKENLCSQMTIILKEKNVFEKALSEKNIEIADLEAKVHELIEIESNLDIEVCDVESRKNIEIEELKANVDEKENQIIQLNIERETFKSTILELQNRITTIETEIEEMKTNHENTLKKKEVEITTLQETINDLTQNNIKNSALAENLAKEKEDLCAQMTIILNEKNVFEKTLSEKDIEIANLEAKIHELMEIESNLDIEVFDVESRKNIEIEELKENVDEKENQINQLNIERETLKTNILELQNRIAAKTDEVTELNSKLSEITLNLEHNKSEFESYKKESENNINALNDKLLTISGLKDENIQHFKDLIAEKDQKVIDLNVEMNKFKLISERLSDELKEAQAELEISRTELLTLDEEAEDIVHRNESNLLLKNQDLRQLNDEVVKLYKEIAKLNEEKEILRKETTIEKQVLENKIKELEGARLEVISKLELIDEKDKIIAETENKLQEWKSRVEELENSAESETLSKREEEMQYKQLLQARLDHTEGKRLTAECELQDLLQHNHVLEADVAALKRRLEEAQKELEKQSTRVASSAGEAGLQMTEEALVAMDRGSAYDSNQAAAELAASAFDQLASHTQVKGNEEAIARSAMLAAHNTACLSAYVTELCNTSTDLEIADKLNKQCRDMLYATRQCLESVRSGGSLSDCCREAGAGARGVARGAAALQQPGTAASVDDELANMDAAIEQAANQIEAMLAASRAGDSGVKLEVNEKILDACTTLMAAVKVLVQDARKLQNELGDPSTRHKMYRRNPQWSEGLISAAKAVVFAAKLLVSSADEAVCGSGRVSGVMAGAHEVAGSTAQLVAASRARAPPASPALASLAAASRHVAAATGALVAAVRAASTLLNEQEALDTSTLTLTATRRLEMESKVRSLELESALDNERARLAALRKRHYQLAQLEENGGITNGKE